jgi:hypothetical protein
MKLIVNPHKIEIIKDEAVNEREIDISKCVFEFHEDITNDYVKEAYFTLNNQTYKQIIINNECSFPSEVLEKQGTVEIGVVAYLVENEEEIKRYNPSPVYFNTWQGSLKEAQNSEPITPSEMEQFEQELQEGLNEMAIAIESAEKLDIDVNKVGGTTTVEITKQDGTTKTEEVIDGIGLDYNWNGTSLGVKREDEDNYSYANLKGDKGDAGAIKFEIVVELPTENIKEDTIYLVPITPDLQENNYAEYIYVNGQWELLGKIGVHVDLSSYYTKTESDNRYLQNSKIVILTQAEYDLIETKDPTVYYLIKEV